MHLKFSPRVYGVQLLGGVKNFWHETWIPFLGFHDPMFVEVYMIYIYVFQMGWLKPPTIVVVLCIYTLEK